MASFIAQNQAARISTKSEYIPLPVVNLSRWTCIVTVMLAMIFNLPVLTTILMVVYAPSVFFGRQYSLVGWVGKRVFAAQIPGARRESNRLIHFNSTLIVTLLALAQVCFFMLNMPTLGWVFSLMVVAANGLALLGFCVGCVFFFGLKFDRLSFFGRNW